MANLSLRSHQDGASGLLFIAAGLGFAYVSTSYQMGTADKMGPGFFPFWLGILLAVLGAIVFIGAFSAKREEDRIGKWDIRSVLWVTGSIALFGLLLKPLGLILALLSLIFVSAMASHEFHWKGTLVNAIILIVIAYAAFVWGLNLQFPVWPAFIAS